MSLRTRIPTRYLVVVENQTVGLKNFLDQRQRRKMSDRRRSKRLAEYAAEPAEVKVAKLAEIDAVDEVDAKSVKWVREEKALVSTVYFI